MSDYFNWNEDITVDENEFVVLYPGKYAGEVSKIEKMRQEGGAMNGCAYALVTVTVPLEGATAILTDRLYLSRKMEWKISQFLKACGLKKKGEPIKVSRIDKALHKPITVTVGCKYGKDRDYAAIDSVEEAKAAIESGEIVYNEIKKYDMPANEEEDTISDDEFGFGG